MATAHSQCEVHAGQTQLDVFSPPFCRFVLPPIKTESRTKMLPIRLCFINVYIYPNPTPTPYSNADTVNIVVQREKRMIYGCEVGKSDRMITCQDTGIPSSFGDVCANRLWAQ